MNKTKVALIILIEFCFLSSFVLKIYQNQNNSCTVAPGNQFAFWQASVSFLKQINPFKPELGRKHIIQQTHQDYGMPEVSWAPPHSLIIMSWFGFFPYEKFLRLNIIFETCLTLIAILILSLRYNLYKNIKILSLSRLFILSLYLLPLMIYCAPLLPIVFISLSSFLLIVKHRKITSSVIGGLFLSLSTIKPHPIYYLYVLIGVLSIKRSDFKTLIGLTLGVLGLVTLSILISPSIIQQYLSEIKNFPIGYLTPTILSTVAETFNLNRANLVLYSLITSIFIIPYFYLKNKYTDNQLILIAILISLLLAPYLWSYEFILTLPAFCYLLIKIKNDWFLLIGMAVNYAMLCYMKPQDMHYQVCYNLIILSLLILVMIKNKDRK